LKGGIKMEKLMTLEETIEIYKDLSNFDIEYLQLTNWLKSLKEYYNKDIPKLVERICLDGTSICPRCEEHMALGVKNYCDKCGQSLKWE
jgi:hypothetical protein